VSRASLRATLQHIGKPGKRINTIQLRGLDQGGDDHPVLSTFIAASEQSILAFMDRCS
jgi:hypothetical protein